MITYPFPFGKCTTSTFGSVVVDMIDLPNVQGSLEVSDTIIGGSTRSLDGTLRQDRFGLKREYSAVAIQPYLATNLWAPLKRLYRLGGPYMFMDHTIETMLTPDQQLLRNGTWTNASGSALTVRGDGATSLAISGVAQQGPSTSPTKSLLVPVTVGQQYFAGCTVVGTGSWAVTVVIAWYTLAGTTALSTSTVASAITSSTALSTCLCLDGSVIGFRVGGAATAPATAAYAQIRISTATAAADVSDPVFIIGPADPGNAMTVVQVNSLNETQVSGPQGSLVLDMSEV